MSELTLSEAIKHCLEVAEQNEKKAEYRPRMDYYDEIESRADCLECAADHRQLAEWLTELKELRAEQNEQYVFIRELMSNLMEIAEKFDKAKELLKVAVKDFANMDYHIYECDGMCDTCPIHGNRDECDKWRYTDEALEIIKGDMRSENS